MERPGRGWNTVRWNRLNPFSGLKNPREVWSWGMYDLANQSFTLLIITLLFPLYFRQVIVGDESRGDALWGLIHGGSMLAVVVFSPILGALADGRGWRRQTLLTTGICCSLLTCTLGLLGESMLLVAAGVYMLANLMYQLGENFLASFLPGISTPKNMGRISAIGWSMGYLGALLLMVLTATMMWLFDLGPEERWRPLFVFAGVWFLGGLIPAMLFLRDDAPDPRVEGESLMRASFGRLLETARRVRQYRQLAVFLVGFLIYGFGVQVIIAFASILASDFGFEQQELVLFVLQLSVTAGITAAFVAMFQDRIGARNVVLIFLGVWILSTLSLLVLSLMEDAPSWSMWIVGNGLGMGLGGIGTSSRTMVGRFTPRHRSAEFFGLWGMTYKLAGAIGVLSFGMVKSVFGDAGALALLMMFFVIGTVIVLFVSERAGVLAARRAEREEAGGQAWRVFRQHRDAGTEA